MYPYLPAGSLPVVSIESLRKAFNGSQNAVAVVRVQRDSSMPNPNCGDTGSTIYGSTPGSTPMSVHLNMNRRSTGTKLGHGSMVFSGGGSAGSQLSFAAAVAATPSASSSLKSLGRPSIGKEMAWDDALSDAQAEEASVRGTPATCSLDPVYLNKAVLRMLDIRTMQVRLVAMQGVQDRQIGLLTCLPSPLNQIPVQYYRTTG